MRVLIILIALVGLFSWLYYGVLTAPEQKIPRAIVGFLGMLCSVLFVYIFVLGMIQGF
ncbi:MAG: hypothetical protein ACQES2_01030 [Pseudomonadota bacterium]